MTLYELLSLQSAFPDTNAQHLIHLITQETPVRLRKLNPHIPTDLETIIHKAAVPDSAHRYQSPGELAEDLRRFLDDRPILARRTGPVKLAWRWCRRNPALAAATAAVFLLMVAITVVSVVAYAQTAAANRETANALESEKIQRQGAEQASTLALDALNRIFDRFAPTRQVVTPQEPTEAGVELPPQPTLPPEAIPLLEDLLRTYEQLAHAGEEYPRLRAQAAEANYRIGEICQRLGRLERAAAAYRSSVDLYTRQVESSTGSTPRIKLARAYNELGRTLQTLQQPDEARQMHGKAIQTLAELPSDLAGRPEVRYELARSYYTLDQRDMLYSAGPPGKGRPHPARPAGSWSARPGPTRPASGTTRRPPA